MPENTYLAYLEQIKPTVAFLYTLQERLGYSTEFFEKLVHLHLSLTKEDMRTKAIMHYQRSRAFNNKRQRRDLVSFLGNRIRCCPCRLRFPCCWSWTSLRLCWHNEHLIKTNVSNKCYNCLELLGIVGIHLQTTMIMSLRGAEPWVWFFFEKTF
jgi:hypothetical protein